MQPEPTVKTLFYPCCSLSQSLLAARSQILAMWTHSAMHEGYANVHQRQLAWNAAAASCKSVNARRLLRAHTFTLGLETRFAQSGGIPDADG